MSADQPPSDQPSSDQPSSDQPASDVPDRFTVDFSGLTLLGIYRVQEKIAEGGMGSIYLGSDENLSRAVVIKVPHVKFLSEPGFRPRFAREIKELVRLEHPSIVRILAQGEHEQVPFFVLQYLGGGSLEEKMDASDEPLPPTEFMPWMRTIARTLDFVHARGTIHRDVKPANIIFDEDGHVFLSDFGVAKVLEDHGANLTEAGTGIGSPKYMAPEQGYGAELTPSADQYALGSMLYEGISGRAPFPQANPIEVLVKKASTDPDDLGELVSDLPRDAADAVMKALARSPDDRHASCMALLDAFEQGYAPPPNEEPRRRTIEVTAKVSTPVFVAAVVFAAVLAGLVYLWTGDAAIQGRVDGASNSLPGITLTLLDAGAEPHRPMRYKAASGSRDTFTLTSGRSIDVKIQGRTVYASPSDAMSLTIHLENRKVEPNGDIHTHWEVAEVKMPDDKELSADAQKANDVVYEEMRGLSGSVVFTSNGLPRSSKLDVEKELVPLLQQVVDVHVWTLRTLPIPFPEERIGDGARWEVTETTSVMGMRVTHTVTYELMKLDGDHMHIQAHVAETAAQQPFKAGPLPSTLLELQAKGASTSVVFLEHLTPVMADFEMTMKMKNYYAKMKPGEALERSAIGTMNADIKMTIRRK